MEEKVFLHFLQLYSVSSLSCIFCQYSESFFEPLNFNRRAGTGQINSTMVSLEVKVYKYTMLWIDSYPENLIQVGIPTSDISIF